MHDAVSTRLMLSIGEWALQTACQQYRTWLDTVVVLPLTLNLSTMELRTPRLLQTLARIVDETGVPASMLQLEIDERVVESGDLERALEQIKQSGFRIALRIGNRDDCAAQSR